MSKNTKQYIADLCGAIDVLWSISFIVLLVRTLWTMGGNWEYTAIAFAGVLVWPAKKSWAKWLQLDVLPKSLDLEILTEIGYRVTDIVKGEENKILVVLEKGKTING